MFIDGKFVDSTTKDWIDLHDPATNEIVTRVPKSTPDEMQAAVESAKRAYKTWSQTSILTRQQVMLRFQAIIRANMTELAKNITREQGKTLVDAEGDVLRGLRKFIIRELANLITGIFPQRLLNIVAVSHHFKWARQCQTFPKTWILILIHFH